MTLLNAFVSSRSLSERKRRGNRHAQPSCACCVFQFREMLVSGFSVVGNKCEVLSAARLGLNAIRIRDPSASPDQIQAALESVSSCQGKNCIESIGRKFPKVFHGILTSRVNHCVCTESLYQRRRITP
jgi:hypothetical protein